MPPLLLYLAPYHLGDPSFLQGLARAFKQRPDGAPPVWLVHGSGEAGERELEAQGLFPERKNGLLVTNSPQEAALVERSLRTTNRHIVALLTDQLAPSLCVLGTDRGLMRAASAEGPVALGLTDWLVSLSARGVVPVMGLLAHVGGEAGGEAREVSPVPALAALAERLGAPVVCFLTTGRAGVRAEDGAPGTKAEVPASDLATLSRLPEPEVPRDLARLGVRVVLTTPLGALSQTTLKGTRVLV